MDIFKEVKERADILKVCDVLGIKLDRNYKALCPFPDHKEKTPSFSVLPRNNIFCCFGCGKKGDVITLVQEILNISPLEAAKFINAHLGLGVETNGYVSRSYVNKYEQKQLGKERFLKWENETFQKLCDYSYLLKKWKELKDPENKLYLEALQNEDYVNYIIDEIFINGTFDDKIWFKRNQGKVGKKIWMKN